jgi:hypothetical protein
MNEKYEDKLWSQIEILHQKNKRQQVSFNYFIDMLNKFQEACFEFSKNIQNILSKTHEIIENHSTTMYESIEKFVILYETFNKEFKEAQNAIKTQIIDQILKPTNDLFNKEKEYYNSYNKIKTLYNSSKVSLDKCKQNYDNNMKLCESAIFNSKQIDVMIYAGEEEKIKNAKSANNSIKNTKPIEEKYITAVESANKCREVEIKGHTKLLQFYQKMDINFYEKIKYGIGIYLAVANKMCKNIVNASEFLGVAYNKISIEKDIMDFIRDNKVEKNVQSVSEFIPYVPSADPTNKKEDSSKLDIYYEVMKTLKSNFKDIRNDIDIEEETKKKRLRYLCERIFKIGSSVSFSKEEKNELLAFLEIPSYKKYFIVVLSRQRTKGRFKRSESLVRDLADILLKILDLAEKEKDYESAKNCIILSQTYFYEKGEDKKKKDKNESLKKIYLFEFIKNNEWLKSNEFWDGLITLMINVEVKKNEETAAKQGIEETETMIKSRLSNICFSQLITFTSNMLDFGIDKVEVEKIVDDYCKKYEIQKEFIEVIYSNINTKSQEIKEAQNKTKISIRKNSENKEVDKTKEANKEKNAESKEKKDNIKEENIIKDDNIKNKKEENKNNEANTIVKEENKKDEVNAIVKEENKNDEVNTIIKEESKIDDNKEKEQLNEVKVENEIKSEENINIESNEKKEQIENVEKIENKEDIITKENEVDAKNDKIEDNKKEINIINEEEKKEEINNENKNINQEIQKNEDNIEINNNENKDIKSDENKNESIQQEDDSMKTDDNQNLE